MYIQVETLRRFEVIQKYTYEPVTADSLKVTVGAGTWTRNGSRVSTVETDLTIPTIDTEIVYLKFNESTGTDTVSVLHDAVSYVEALLDADTEGIYFKLADVATSIDFVETVEESWKGGDIETGAPGPTPTYDFPYKISVTPNNCDSFGW